jgi:thiamine biosynthesis lipoprotein
LNSKASKVIATLLAAALVILAIVRMGILREKGPASSHQSRILMDTVVSIRVYRGDAERIDQAVEAAFEEMARLDSLLSAWKPDSDISRINRSAGEGTVAVDPRTWEAIGRIQSLTELTRGAFDLTIGAVTRLWDFSSPEAAPPDSGAIRQALPLVDRQQIVVDSLNHRIGLRRRGARLDPGGAAKGYIVDRAIAVLQEHGIEAALIDAGGDIGLLGKKIDGQPWKIGIRNPVDPDTTLEIIAVESGAVATSGNYERFHIHDRIRYHHILDPKTGWPVPHVVSVTILAPTTLEADILSTAVFVLGPGKGLTLIEQLSDIEGVIYLEGPRGLRRVASSNFPPSTEEFNLSQVCLPPRRS